MTRNGAVIDPELDVDTGYRAQRMVVQHRLDRGERVIGALGAIEVFS